MTAIIYQWGEQYLTLNHYKSRIWLVGTLELALKNEKIFSQLTKNTTEYKKELLTHFDELKKQEFHITFANPNNDPTKCLITNLDKSHEEIIKHLTTMVEIQQGLRTFGKELVDDLIKNPKLKKQFEKLLKEEESLRMEKDKNSENLIFPLGYINSYFDTDYAKKGDSPLKNIFRDMDFLGHKGSIKALLNGEAQRTTYNKNTEKFEGKAYVVLSLDGDGYLDFQKNCVALNKARTFNNPSDAENFASNGRNKSRHYTIAEVSVQFSKVLDGDLNHEKIAPLVAIAQHQEIKKILSAEQIQTNQLNALVFEEYLISKGINPQQVLKEVLSEIPAEKTTNKEKADFITQKIAAHSISIKSNSKPKTL